MNTTFNAIFALVAVISVVLAIPARADSNAIRVSMVNGATVVEVLDEAQLESEIGQCASGYTIRARVDAGVRTFPLTSGRVVIAPSTSASPYPNPQFFCAGHPRPFPRSVEYR